MSGEPSLGGAYVRSERMVGRRIADEYVLVPIIGSGAEVDSIFNLSRVGAFIWERLDGRSSGDEIVAAVTARFDVSRTQAEADYREFIAQLLSITAVSAATPAAEGSG